MNKTKSFTQYTNDDINIGFKIGIDCKIHESSMIRYQGKLHRKKCKEWKEENKEHKKECDKKYYENNKNEIKQNREYNKEHKKDYDKKYYKNNKENLDKRNKEWIKNNHDKVLIYKKKNKAKRRGWGYNPINEPFEDSHFHHLHINGDKNIGIHIPAELHRSISHRNYDKESMDKINELAFEWLKNNKDY